MRKIIMAFSVMALLAGSACNKSDNQNSFLETLCSRVSVRNYTSKSVEKDKIDNMLKAAMSAPSAVNKQPWAFVVISDRKLLDQIGDSLPNSKMIKNAQLAIAVLGDMSKKLEGQAGDFWIQDASAAAENLLLAAHAQGLGAVWTGIYPDAKRCSTASQILQLDAKFVVLCIIPIGYPAENPAVKDKWNPDNIIWK